MASETLILFLLGAAIGSFLNVLTLRYSENQRIFSFERLSGRSRCPKCRVKLSWQELVPLVSFVLQRGRCRNCDEKISLQYPVVEAAAGLIFAFMPGAVANAMEIQFYRNPLGGVPVWYYALIGLFLVAALTLVAISAIDARLRIIPDQSTILVAVTGGALMAFHHFSGLFEFGRSSFLGHYALLFGLRENVFLNYFVAALFGLALFGAIFFLSRGRGMGLGDVKLAGALGLFLGWPDAAVGLGLAFVTGAVWSIILMIHGRKNLKSAVPFGPFMALGALLVIFFGRALMDWYFGLFA